LRTRAVIDCIAEQEYKLAKLKFVHSVVPDVRKVNNFNPLARYKALNVEFVSKLVNTQYTDVKFITQYNALYIAPIIPVTFNYTQGDLEKTEEIIIGSSPKLNRLAYIHYDRKLRSSTNSGERIKFSRFTFNMKKHNFDDKIFTSCRTAIMKYIQEHPGIAIDTKHLEPRLQKLLVYI
jgi:hypothetical protein